jgi:O-antigen ligase
VMIEIFPLGWPDSLTDQVPFFLNLNNSTGLSGFSGSPAEIFMGVALLAWLTSSASRGWQTLKEIRILRAYVAYIAVVFLAELHGLASGGNFNVSLWELRPQVYAFLIYVMAATLLRERRQFMVLAGIFLAGAAIKAGIGYNRYFFTLHQDLGTAEAMLAHEESYFLALLLIATVVAIIWYWRPKLVIPLVLISPLVFIVLLENRRRAATLALWAGLAVVMLLAIWFERPLRKRLIVVTAIAVLALGGFVATFWNDQYGMAAQIVRPLHSILGEPDQRDYSSNLYRINENANLIATYRTNIPFGIGFGIPMMVIYPMADISQSYPFWQYIPHNSLLWVAMRMGLLGMAVFGGLVGTALIEAISLFRTKTDAFMRGVAAFAVAAIIAELIVGFGDLQLENYRNMIFFGAVLGTIDAARRLPALVPAARRAGLLSRAPAALPIGAAQSAK